MLHKNWEMTSEEQRVRIAQMKAQTERISTISQDNEDDGVMIINDLQEGGKAVRDSDSEIP